MVAITTISSLVPGLTLSVAPAISAGVGSGVLEMKLSLQNSSSNFLATSERPVSATYVAKLQTVTTDDSSIIERIRDILNADSIDEIMGHVTREYPEMSWLAGSVNATPEGFAISDPTQSVSQRMFGAKHIEFDRTAVGIMTFLWVIKGDYEKFTECQPEAARMTRQSFEELRSYTLSILADDPKALDALIAYTVINDLGKIKAIVAEVQKHSGSDEIDHDKILYNALEHHPEVSPSFSRLSDYYKDLIVNGLKAKFNLGQFVQGENIPASLSGLIRLDSASLDFYLLHVVYDIAGVAGQVKQNGSLVMNESTYQGFKLSLAALGLIAEGMSLDKVYDAFLAEKAKIFGLDISNPTERAVTRVCCMLRVADSKQAQKVFDIFTCLPKNERAILEKELNLTGVSDGYATLLYYSPATFANAQVAFKAANDPQAFEKSMQVGLRVFARVYQEARIAIKKREGNGVYIVDVSALAEAAKNPTTLDTKGLRLDKVGDDAKLALYDRPTIDVATFPRMDSLSDMPGQRIVPIGIGGGSDVIQAAMMGQLFTTSGKVIPAVISVRTTKTGSQDTSGIVGKKRTVENHGGEIAPGIYRITPETTGSGRFLENIPANEVPIFLVIDTEDGTLTAKIQKVIDEIGGVDTVLAVDTGGDALYSTTVEEGAKATPDQDVRVLSALAGLNIRVVTAEIATGVDSPDNAQEVLVRAGAKYFSPNADQSSAVMAKYAAWDMTGNNEARYGKTPLSWQLALSGMTGFQSIALPTRIVIDGRNPWNPFVMIQASMSGVFFMDLEDHLHAIGVKLEAGTGESQRENHLKELIDKIETHSGVRPVWHPETRSYTPHFVVIPPEQVESFLHSILRNPLIIEDAKREGSLYHEIIKNAAKYPLFIHVPSGDEIERLNFTSWIRVLTLRTAEYESETFADLYLLHELRHMTTMPFGIYPSARDWDFKMLLNEKESSLVSEALVYFAIPGLRPHMPLKEMWVDRFLNNVELLDPSMTNQEFYTKDPERFFRTLLFRFHDINRHPVETLDPMERRSALYTESVKKWNELWHDQALDVDRHMVLFQQLAVQDPKRATPFHLDWLAERTNQRGILFHDKAEAYYKASSAFKGESLPFEEALQAHARFLRERREANRVTPTQTLLDQERLLGFGITSTVYALPWKESEEVVKRLWREAPYDDLYGDPYRRRQDEEHVTLIEGYKRWAVPIVDGLEEYEFPYAANGSSDAIRDAIAILIKTKDPGARLHIFNGDYEGAVAYAQGLGVEVVQHERKKEILKKMGERTTPGDFFYISQPSSLDGNVWEDYDLFMAVTADSGLQVMVDLAYVGAVAKEFNIDVSHPHISAVFFSLSKSFGVYYHRIGGGFFREPNPLLFGNIWFKNVFSQRLGAELMERYSVYEIPRRYRPLQEEAVTWVNDQLGTEMTPSDVILLGAQPLLQGRATIEDERLQVLYRGGVADGFLRACLTAWMNTRLRGGYGGGW